MKNVEPWSAGLKTPGTKSITVMVNYFASGPREKLRPDPALLKSQPGEKNRNNYVAAASSEDGSWQVVYTPFGGKLSLNAEQRQNPLVARWLNPRTGEFGKPIVASGDSSTLTYTAPTSEDWVLDLRRAKP